MRNSRDILVEEFKGRRQLWTIILRNEGVRIWVA
jgi:hypothetical protein